MSKNTNLSFLTDYITADITNGRIGINNASPTVAFDVSGATKISGALTLTSTISNGTYTYTLPSATGTLALTSALSGTTNYVPKFTSSSAISNSQIFDNGTNVGIGTTSPNISGGASGSTALTISATASGRNGIIELKGTRTASGQISSYIRSFSNSGATPGVDLVMYRGTADTDGELAIATSGTERMRINSAGNVAINNTTGTIYSKLSVAGAISFNNNTNSAVSGGEYGNAYAKTISVIAGGSAVSIKPGLGPESSLILVSGRSTTGNRFSDLILVIGQGTTAPTVIASRTYLSPATRTYTNGGESLVLQLTESSETYTIFLTGIGGNESS